MNRDLSTIILESCIQEAMDWKNVGKGAAIGATAGAGAGIIKYMLDRRKLKKELSNCKNDNCREEINKKLSELKKKGLVSGLALGAAGGAIGAAGGQIKSDVDAHKKLADKQNNEEYKRKFVRDRDNAVKTRDDFVKQRDKDISFYKQEYKMYDDRINELDDNIREMEKLLSKYKTGDMNSSNDSRLKMFKDKLDSARSDMHQELESRKNTYKKLLDLKNK